MPKFIWIAQVTAKALADQQEQIEAVIATYNAANPNEPIAIEQLLEVLVAEVLQQVGVISQNVDDAIATVEATDNFGDFAISDVDIDGVTVELSDDGVDLAANDIDADNVADIVEIEESIANAQPSSSFATALANGTLGDIGANNYEINNGS